MNNKEHRFYLDTEFIQYTPDFLGLPVLDLISIGIVDENNKEFYRINANCNFTHADSWVQENVMKPMGITLEPSLDGNGMATVIDCLHPDNEYGWACVDDLHSKWVTKPVLVTELKEYIDNCKDDKSPVFYTFYGAYDWVIFCSIFGRMIDLPEGYPMYTRDLKQTLDEMGLDPTKFMKDGDYHNALGDAKWNKELHEYLMANYETIHRNV